MRGEEHFFPGSPGESQYVLGVGLERTDGLGQQLAGPFTLSREQSHHNHPILSKN